MAKKARENGDAHHTCKTCPFFRSSSGVHGACHHGPPTLMSAAVPSPRSVIDQTPTLKWTTASAWPPTVATESCGQHPSVRVALEALIAARVSTKVARA